MKPYGSQESRREPVDRSKWSTLVKTLLVGIFGRKFWILVTFVVPTSANDANLYANFVAFPWWVYTIIPLGMLAWICYSYLHRFLSRPTQKDFYEVLDVSGPRNVLIDRRMHNSKLKQLTDTSMMTIRMRKSGLEMLVCKELLDETIFRFSGSKMPTLEAIENFVKNQSQYNLNAEESVMAVNYMPMLVRWHLNKMLTDKHIINDEMERALDYSELSQSDIRRRYNMWFYAFFKSKKALKFADIVIGWTILCFTSLLLTTMGVWCVSLTRSAGVSLINSFSTKVTVRDLEFGSLAGLQLPKEKPIKPDFRWIREPTTEYNNREKSTVVTNVLPLQHMPIYAGYRYNRRSAVNLKRSIDQRVAVTNVTEAYKPDYALMKRETNKLIDRLMPIIQQWKYPTRDAVVEWLETKTYPVHRKVAILKAYDEAPSIHARDLLGIKNARVEAFIKDEWYPAYKNPRAILARGDLGKAIFGPIFDELNRAFFTLPETVKKLPAHKRPEYIENTCSGPYYYVTDHTAFECSATADVQTHMESIVYKRLCGSDNVPYLNLLLKDQRVAVGNGSAHVPVSRFSGEMNTSLGNSITNYVFIRMLMSHFGSSGNFYIEGDDGLLCFQQELDVDLVREFAVQNGFNLKIDRVKSPGTAGFLSTYWNTDNQCYKLPLGKYLTAAAWMNPHSRVPPKELLVARLGSMMEENPGNYLLNELYLGFKEKYSLEGVILKEADNYAREKLTSRGVTFTEYKGMLEYAAPKFNPDRDASFAELVELYNCSYSYLCSLSERSRTHPEETYAEVCEIFLQGEHPML